MGLFIPLCWGKETHGSLFPLPQLPQVLRAEVDGAELITGACPGEQ